ncbi:TBP-domain-containing protein [Parathielavia hyrcaniae]|uniref:TBP-domain-containing protein n=1 Tax=Parathielavia hyrcaniae TaxID=113614 RepID=A0AAN6PV05_9PEZI|nr:TBP-domain-containing protein [Parathielavia hyrcaniae]
MAQKSEASEPSPLGFPWPSGAPMSSTDSPEPQDEPARSWRDRIRPDWPVPQIQNVVATVYLGCRLDLQLISQQARNVEYNRKKFHAVIMRIRDPRTTTLVFSSGRMVVTGAKSEPLAQLAARRHARALQKCGFPTGFRDFKVQNLVSSVSCGFPVRLEGIERLYWESAKYEPELFPGLVYAIVRPQVKCLVFTTGKVVLMGAKREEDVYEAFVKLYPILLDSKKGDVVPTKPLLMTADGSARSSIK